MEITITLYKNKIRDFIDAITFKRVDAVLDQNSERSQNALSSDADDIADGFLMSEFCDRRDAELRARLRFCLISEESSMTFDNSQDDDDAYVYKLNAPEGFTQNDLKGIGKKMDEYIKRGAVFSWYVNAGLEPTDTEAAINSLLDDITGILRGQPWGRRPMQPFGPAFFNYYSKR